MCCLVESNWKHISHMGLRQNCNQTVAYCWNGTLAGFLVVLLFFNFPTFPTYS